MQNAFPLKDFNPGGQQSIAGKHSIVVTRREKISYPRSIKAGNTLLITGTKVRDYIRADRLQNICPGLGSQHSMFQNTKYKMTGDW